MSVRKMLSLGLFAGLLAVTSQVSIPLPFVPVPVTIQVFVVLITGMVLGARGGTLCVGLWILLGSLGLPVFAQGKAGLAVLAGPTGGFLAGFLAAAYLVGRITESPELTLSRAGWATAAGILAIYAFGLAGFWASFKFFLHKPMGLAQAFELAVLPFLPLDIAKGLMAACIGVRVRRALISAGLAYDAKQ